MARKKQLDKLTLENMQALATGMSYGKWKALQKPVEIEEPPLPDDWRVCAWCGKPFKLKTKRNKVYCECFCQMAAQRERDRQKHAQYQREWRARQEGNN